MSDLAVVPPGLILIVAGFLIAGTRGRVQDAVIVLAPLLTLWWVWQVPDGVQLTAPLLGYELEIVKGTTIGRLFATIFSIMAFGGGLFALPRKNTVELSAAFVYAGSAVGVTFAGDLITLFVFWEIMAVGSTLIIMSAGTLRARQSGMRYLLVHLLGGVVLMAGIAGEISASGSVTFTHMTPDTLARWMILGGFLLNAGAPPLSAWLPDAYPEASPSGMVFLSAFTTKTAVFVLLVGFAGAEVLIYIGLYMVFYGIVYAILENDMRRILAYSIVNQVGFMVIGIGIGTELALNGAASHAFAHIIYKALLLMSAGSVLSMTGKRKCTDLGGLFRTMPLTATCGIVGALSISAFPWTSGFISKSMISQGAADGHMLVLYFLLGAASAGVFLHAGIKFPWFVFFQKDSGMRPPEPPWAMRLAMIFFSVLCIGIGVVPGALYALLPFPVDYIPYTGDHVVGMLQLLLFSGLAFFLLLPALKRTLTITLDWDWFWRSFGSQLATEFSLQGSRALLAFTKAAQRRAEHLIAQLYRHHGPQGVLARTWPTGSMVLWVAILLGGYLLLYFI
ncbi:MAG: Na(+)/H(+) antiporter subunit D [Alphaproteobacteria bacterium]|nr:Na(+)/H(+) antiporter subunit D [Alphaproteobacteria bacterium]